MSDDDDDDDSDDSVFVCCGYLLADLGALERHKTNRHLPPVDLHLKFTAAGWASR